MIATLTLITLLVIATSTDLTKHKIYNWTTYAGTAIAILLAAVATWFDANGIATVNFKQSLFGFLACGGAMLICFVCFQIGGGDVKLIAMIGAFIGPDFGIQVLLWTFVLGAGAAAILLAWKLGTVNLALRLLQQLLSRLEFGNWQPLTVEEKNQLQLKLYLAPYALLAFVIVRLSSNGSLIV